MPTATEIANDFENYAPGVASVTVQQINPDSGTQTDSSSGVPGLKRVTRSETVGVGDGEIGSTVCKFWLRADEVGFTPRARDRIVDADGITWVIGDVDTVGQGALYVCSGCVKLRS